jgi:hypothetical protein
VPARPMRESKLRPYTVRRRSYIGHSYRSVIAPSAEEEIHLSVEARCFVAGYVLFKRSAGERREIRRLRRNRPIELRRATVHQT